MSTRATASISNMMKHVGIKQPGGPNHAFGDLDAYRNGTGDGPKDISFNTMRDWHAKHARGGDSFSTTDKSETKMSDYMSIINGVPSRWKVMPLVCYMKFKCETSSKYRTNNDGAVAIAVQGNREWTSSGGPTGSATVKLKSEAGAAAGTGPVIKTWSNVTDSIYSHVNNIGGSRHYDISIYWNDLNGELPQWEHHFRFQLGTVDDTTATTYKTDRKVASCNQPEIDVIWQDTGVFYAGSGARLRFAMWGSGPCPSGTAQARPNNTIAQTWSRPLFVGLPKAKDDTTGYNTGSL